MSSLLLLFGLNLQGLPSPALGGGTVIAATFASRVIRRLNETAGTEAGSEAADGGEPDVTSTTQTIYDYANEGIALLCRTCWPLLGTFTQAPAAGGSRSLLYGAFAPASDAPGGIGGGAVLWQPLMDGVLWQPAVGQPSVVPVRLRYCTEQALSLRYRDYLTVAPAAWSRAITYYWHPIGAAGLGTYPPILPGNGAFSVRGLCIHPPAQTSSGLVAMYPYLPDDLLVTVEFYVCWALAAKNQDDPILAQRAPVWLGEFEKRRQQLYARLDPLMRLYFPPLTAIQTAGEDQAMLASGGNQ